MDLPVMEPHKKMLLETFQLLTPQLAKILVGAVDFFADGAARCTCSTTKGPSFGMDLRSGEARRHGVPNQGVPNQGALRHEPGTRLPNQRARLQVPPPPAPARHHHPSAVHLTRKGSAKDSQLSSQRNHSHLTTDYCLAMRLNRDPGVLLQELRRLSHPLDALMHSISNQKIDEIPAHKENLARAINKFLTITISIEDGNVKDPVTGYQYQTTNPFDVRQPDFRIKELIDDQGILFEESDYFRETVREFIIENSSVETRKDSVEYLENCLRGYIFK
ncbi:hypothetical protein RUND412_011086, partial [Rhizina undulata]